MYEDKAVLSDSPVRYLALSPRGREGRRQSRPRGATPRATPPHGRGVGSAPSSTGNAQGEFLSPRWAVLSEKDSLGAVSTIPVHQTHPWGLKAH